MNKNVFLQFILIVFVLFLFPFQLLPQLDSAKLNKYNFIASEITKKVLTEKKGYKFLKELCDIGPRLSGSENSLRAICWAEEKLKSFDVDKVWLQPVMVPHWERGSVETETIVKTKLINE